MPFKKGPRDEQGRKCCGECQEWKAEEEFSWHSREHLYRDSRCRKCRAVLQTGRRKPKHTVKEFTFPYGLTKAMHGHLDAPTLAYIAGLVDGEGSIWSSHPKSNNCPLVLSVTMIHRPTIEWLHQTCGGQFEYRRSYQPKARQAWTWRLKGARTFSLLTRLLPYMRTKRDEAEVALELGETLWSTNVRGRITEETLVVRRRLGQTLRDLKRLEWGA